MNISWLHIVSFIAIFQALLMAAFSIGNKKNSRTCNVLLASMLVVFAVVSSASLYKGIVPLEIQKNYHKQFFIVGHLAFLIGPLLYFYVKSLLEIKFSFHKQDWLHVLPFIIAVVYSLIIFQQYVPFHIRKYPGRIYFNGAVLLQNFVYLLASLKILSSYGLTVKSFLSYIDNSKLEWVRFFISGYIVLWIIQLQLFIGWEILANPPWCPYARSLYFLMTFLLFNGMVYIGLKRPEIFHQGPKYQFSILKEPDKKQYLDKLTSLMSREKLYLNPSLSLTEMAQKLNIAPRYVSQIINETGQQNFYDYVNKYRIEESKRLLSQQNQYLNIMGIALDAGFNSKSSFNNAFRKHTGITPKEYKKRIEPKFSL